jgi:hypothetical protein
MRKRSVEDEMYLSKLPADGFVPVVKFFLVCCRLPFHNGLVAKLACYRGRKRGAKAQRADAMKFSPSVVRSQTSFTKTGG